MILVASKETISGMDIIQTPNLSVISAEQNQLLEDKIKALLPKETPFEDEYSESLYLDHETPPLLCILGSDLGYNNPDFIKILQLADVYPIPVAVLAKDVPNPMKRLIRKAEGRIISEHQDEKDIMVHVFDNYPVKEISYDWITKTLSRTKKIMPQRYNSLKAILLLIFTLLIMLFVSSVVTTLWKNQISPLSYKTQPTVGYTNGNAYSAYHRMIDNYYLFLQAARKHRKESCSKISGFIGRVIRAIREFTIGLYTLILSYYRSMYKLE
jgi:hypothetical protein